jgi:putative endonuclease
MSNEATKGVSRPDRRARGALGEEIAAAFLALRGYRIEERNYRCGHREIDLIAARGSLVIFVEVKLRHTGEFGGPARAVGRGKQADVLRAAVGYLQTKGRATHDLRFDVVTVEMEDAGRALRVEHIENAFEGGGTFTL